MAGKCGCGSGAALRLDPAACNALSKTASGLLVPRTVLTGIAPGGNVSTTRSVDVDVTETPGCPDAWAVGARLTPVGGQTTGLVGLGSAAYDTWTAVPGTDLTLPEAGLYEVVADVQAGAIMPGSVSNAYVQARLFDVTAGAVIPLSSRTVFLFSDTPSNSVHTFHGNASPAALYQVVGPVTLRVEGLKHVDAGTSQAEVLFVPNFRFRKVSD
jgi:hypothetical protein